LAVNSQAAAPTRSSKVKRVPPTSRKAMSSPAEDWRWRLGFLRGRGSSSPSSITRRGAGRPGRGSSSSTATTTGGPAATAWAGGGGAGAAGAGSMAKDVWHCLQRAFLPFISSGTV
jgi:hypothetical protein